MSLYSAFETALSPARCRVQRGKDRSCVRADVNHNAQWRLVTRGWATYRFRSLFMILHSTEWCCVVRKEVRRDRNDSTDAFIECRGPLNIKNSPPYSGVSAVNHGNEDYLFTIVVSKPRLCCHYDGKMIVKHTLSITSQVAHGT